MKPNLLNHRFSILLLLLVLFSACCKDKPDEVPCSDVTNPECPNFDPCYGKERHIADFIIERKTWFPGPDSLEYMRSDGVFPFGTLRFTAIDSNALSYAWYLGAEVIHDQQFSRNFQPTDLPANTMVDVSLVITYYPDTVCFPNALPRDSIQQSFLVVEPCDLKVDNKFRGVFENHPQDTTDIQISFYDSTLSECGGILYTYNLGGAGQVNQPNGYALTDTAIVFFNGSGSATPNGSITVDPTTNKMHMSIDYFSTHLIFDGIIVP